MADVTELPDSDPFDAIVDAPFDSALSERYLVYALSTITARSLPDLRDGLKPVHRRLLWAMRQLNQTRPSNQRTQFLFLLVFFSILKVHRSRLKFVSCQQGFGMELVLER